MKKYLDNTIFKYNGVVNDRFNYSVKDKAKGEVLVELNLEQDIATITHIDLNGNSFDYEIANMRELQDTIEYILGRKIISEDQWEQSTISSSLNGDFEDWDDDIILS
jgi:hypothetical protein